LNKGLHECEPILVKLVAKAFTVYKTLYYNYIIYFSCDIHHVLTWPHEKNGGVSKYEMLPEIWYSIFQNALKKWRDKYVG